MQRGNLNQLPFHAKGPIILSMDEDQKAWLAILGLLEILERFGTVRRPASAKVIPFPTAPEPQTSGSSLG
jgi:hypothetical protein